MKRIKTLLLFSSNYLGNNIKASCNARLFIFIKEFTYFFIGSSAERLMLRLMVVLGPSTCLPSLSRRMRVTLVLPWGRLLRKFDFQSLMVKLAGVPLSGATSAFTL